jgi:hypothetical protein
MNYSQNYYSYINYVKTLNRTKRDGVYYEKHHIIPRCCGGSNDPSNLVLLTGREHFLAHYLLIKIYKDTEYFSKLITAAVLMARPLLRKEHYTVNARLYEACKIKYSKYRSENQRGKKLSQSTKDKLSARANWSPERKEAYSNSKRKENLSPETRKKNAEKQYKYNYTIRNIKTEEVFETRSLRQWCLERQFNPSTFYYKINKKVQHNTEYSDWTIEATLL